jgi:predicted ribosomally synthesized peptide with SipW-like signal peptide
VLGVDQGHAEVRAGTEGEAGRPSLWIPANKAVELWPSGYHSGNPRLNAESLPRFEEEDRMKKITILALVLVICLATIGVTYGKWTDVITIDGTATSGSLDLRVMNYSGTWAYKDLTTHELVMLPNQSADTNLLYVGGAWAEYGGADDTIDITFQNIFPTCKYFTADAGFLYAGTIPAVVLLNCTWDAGSTIEPYVVFEWFVKHGTDAWVSLVPGVTEIYQNDKVRLDAKIKLPELDSTMNLSGRFTCVVTVQQWDDCVTPG